MEQKKSKQTVRITFTALIVIFLLIGQKSISQNPINCTPDQLMNPLELSNILKENKQVPVIYNIGPGALIPHSKNIGMIKEADNMKLLRDELGKLPKDTQIVVYCGCCPYEHCPNVRPAIQLSKDMKFTNFKLLDLPNNIKVDWINKGYPIEN